MHRTGWRLHTYQRNKFETLLHHDMLERIFVLFFCRTMSDGVFIWLFDVCCGRLEKQLTGSLDWNDTFLNIGHLKSSFPGYTFRVKTSTPTVEPRPPFR